MNRYNLQLMVYQTPARRRNVERGECSIVEHLHELVDTSTAVGRVYGYAQLGALQGGEHNVYTKRF